MTTTRLTTLAIETALLLALALGGAAPLHGQDVFPRYEMDHEGCRRWAPMPGVHDFERDSIYNRCALDGAPELLTPERMPPAPLLALGASAEYIIVVGSDGRVDPEVTWAPRFVPSWSSFPTWRFDRVLREAFTSWRFRPGVRNGVPVRSGFRLHIQTDGREDTIPARLEWSYVRGADEDTLRGRWLPVPAPPPYGPDQALTIYEAMLDRLMEMRVVLRRSDARYCAVMEEPDPSIARGLEQLISRRMEQPAPRSDIVMRQWRWPLRVDCGRSPSALRIVFPRIYRTGGGRAVLHPAGDHLEEWPPGLDGKTYRGWTGRCVADAGDPEDIRTECEIRPLGDPADDAARQTAPGNATPDVEAFLRSYVDAVAARDTAALSRLYAEPARFVWIEDGAVRYRSPDDVFRGLADFPPDASIRTELGDLESVELAGGGVHVWTPFTTTVQTGEQSFSFGGVMSILLEPADGSWRIVGGHVSSPRPR